MKTKICTKCKEEKNFSKFCKSSKAKDGLNWECRGCQSKRNKKLTAKPEVKKRRAKMYLSKRYGLTLEDYNSMLQKQQGCCAMCGRHWTNFSKRFHVDHNHKTGKIRSLLCVGCNIGLGFVEKSGFVNMAKKYLKKFEYL